jgi:protein involved in polysaccharide export with SLBB domain
VDGMSADALTRFLVDSLSVYLRNPSIEVTLLRRINVLGAVQKPDLYLVDASVTVADALALAGGASSNGKTDRVELRRKGKAIEVKLDKDTRLADTPMQSGDQLYVPERGWISRNAGLVAAGLSAATTLVVALMIR